MCECKSDKRNIYNILALTLCVFLFFALPIRTYMWHAWIRFYDLLTKNCFVHSNKYSLYLVAAKHKFFCSSNKIFCSTNTFFLQIHIVLRIHLFVCSYTTKWFCHINNNIVHPTKWVSQCTIFGAENIKVKAYNIFTY